MYRTKLKTNPIVPQTFLSEFNCITQIYQRIQLYHTYFLANPGVPHTFITLFEHPVVSQTFIYSGYLSLLADPDVPHTCISTGTSNYTTQIVITLKKESNCTTHNLL